MGQGNREEASKVLRTSGGRGSQHDTVRSNCASAGCSLFPFFHQEDHDLVFHL